MSRYVLALLTAVLVVAASPSHPAQAAGVRSISLRVEYQRVAPGRQQVVLIQSTPHARLSLSASFPDGAGLNGSITTDARGTGLWSFTQPAHTVTHSSQVGTVTAGYSNASTESAQTFYTIRFDALDVTGQVTVDVASAHLDVWAHRVPGAVIRAGTRPSCGLAPASAVGDRSGWAEFRCSLALPPPSSTYQVQASASVKGHSITVTRTVSMPEAAFDSLVIDDVQVLVQNGDTWQSAGQIPLNRMARLAVLFHATEAAGTWFPPCSDGTITVKKGTQVLWSGLAVCGSTLPPSGGQPYAYLDVFLADPSDIGPVDVGVQLYSGSGTDTKTFQKQVVQSLPG